MVTESFSNKAAWLGVFCTCLVVLMHGGFESFPNGVGWWFDKLVSHGCAQLAVPTFFFLSGYFLAVRVDDVRWYPRAIFKRARSLLVPYAIWAVLYLIAVLVDVGGLRVLEDGIRAFRGVLTELPWVNVFGIDLCRWPMLAPLWYLRTLMAFVVFAPVLFWSIRRTNGLVIVAIWFGSIAVQIFGGSAWDGGIWGFQRFFFNLTGLAFFCGGGLMRFCGDMWCRSRLKWASFSIGLALLVSYPFALRTGLGWLGVLMKEIMIPFLVAASWYLMPSCFLPRLLRGLTFPVYVIHMFIFRLLPTVPQAFPWFVCRCMAVFALSVVIVRILKRFLPQFAEVVFGGR